MIMSKLLYPIFWFLYQFGKLVDLFFDTYEHWVAKTGRKL